jgi:hypothetical protein
MRISFSAITAAALLWSGSCAAIQAQSSSHVIQTPGEAQWGPAPPKLPAGAQIAVLAGDPTKPVPYTIRLNFPANYAIPAHWHPTDENVVVVSGALMPANMNHFAYTTSGATTIILYGQGPVEFKYVKPGDDPRNARGEAK